MSTLIDLSNRDGVRLRRYAVALAALTYMLAFDAAAQTWTYQSYSTGTAVDSPMAGRPLAPGYVTLEEKDGHATIRIVAGSITKCFEGELKADVTKTEATTVITVPPRIGGCDEIRFVIKNDGTGGQREIKKGSEWAWDHYERGLTPKK
jgi:hypothetical protein